MSSATPQAPMVPAPVRRLRIAVLNRNFDPTGGGAERYSIALVEQLAARHEIHVFAQTIRHQFPEVNYHTVSRPFTRPRWINQLWYAIATWWATRRGFDVVHSHEITWHGQVQTVHVLPIFYNLFLGRTGIRRLLRWAKVLTSPRLLAYLWLERQRYAVQPGRAIVVTSSTLLDVMAATYPHTRPMLQRITPGVSSVPGATTADVKRQARVALGLPAEGQVLLFVANDFEKKGLATLLEALADLRGQPTHRTLPGASLAVVGNPVHAAGYAARIRQLGLDNSVFFLGQLPDVGVAYRAADVLAHPTREDTFGMVVLEAMAHGLPVVVSAGPYCGIAALLVHGQNALILQEPADAVALAESLRAALGDEALRERLSVWALAFARPYLWANLSIMQEDVYFESALALIKY